MALKLIVGPPNSGRAGGVRGWLAERARDGRGPLLVVPTATDVQRFRRELAGLDRSDREPVAVGAEVVGFGPLFAIVARALDGGGEQRIAPEQRAALVRRAVARVALRGPLAESAARPGFPIELDRLISDLQAAGADPAAIPDAARKRPALAGLADLYRGYLAAVAQLEGRTDGHGVARAATDSLRARPEGWEARPVAFYGFDDMTGEQLRLVEALADAAEVLVTVTFEDREALAERARLRAELLEGSSDVDEQRLDRNPAYTESALLRHLERQLFAARPQPAELDPAADGGLVVLEAAGLRVQAEQIAIEVARLLVEEGQRPDEVTIAVRSPGVVGPLLAAALAEQGVPAALQAELPVTGTATGRGVAALTRAALPGGGASDVLAFLRAPGVVGAASVDGFELALRRAGVREAGDAVDLWEQRQRDKDGGRPLRELAQLRDARDPAEALSALRRIARGLAERPQERVDGARDETEAVELRAAAAIGAALDALAELGLLSDPSAALAEALSAIEALELPALQGAGEGRVLITSPAAIRARPVANLFVASIQEGEFPAPDRADPLVLDRDRGLLGLPGRASHEAEERFLFYSCVSRPTRRLYLCWRSAEEDGSAAGRSSFLEQVGRAIDPADALGALAPLTRRRELDRIAPAPEEAGSPRQLARALASSFGPAAPSAVSATSVPPETAAGVTADLERALAANAKPGPLTDPGVLAELGERRLFGTSTLEEWMGCSYRWFVGHELSPRPLGPAPEPLAQGGLLHRVLQLLYGERPGGTEAPSPASLASWVQRGAELTEELAGEAGLGGSRPEQIASRSRIEGLIARFLRHEAELAAERRLRPAVFEGGFGERESDERPPLELGDFALHGSIDRIDLTPDGEAGAIFDYKTSREVSIGKHLSTREAIAEHGKLQPGLYALAVRELWGVEPLAALYYPLAATEKPGPRGIARADQVDGELAGLEISGSKDDRLDPDAFAGALDAARETAISIVTEMRAGKIDRVPLGGDCGYCEYSSVCRIERAARIDPEEPDRDEEGAE